VAVLSFAIMDGNFLGTSGNISYFCCSVTLLFSFSFFVQHC
jgi:hypothetical protein